MQVTQKYCTSYKIEISIDGGKHFFLDKQFKNFEQAKSYLESLRLKNMLARIVRIDETVEYLVSFSGDGIEIIYDKNN